MQRVLTRYIYYTYSVQRVITLCNDYFYIQERDHSMRTYYIYNELVHGLGTEVLHPTTLQEWYQFVQGTDTNQNRGVPIDLLGMHYAIWAIFKMAAFENDENNKRSIYDRY